MKLEGKIIATIVFWIVTYGSQGGTALSDRDNEIRGLFDILSSSSEDESNLSFESEERGANQSTNLPIEHPHLFDTTEYLSSDETSNMDLPEPQRLVPILRSKINNERELETSHSDAKELRIKQIKSSLLSKLRLERLPNPPLADRLAIFPHHILDGTPNDRLSMDEPEKEDNYHAKIDQLIRFAQQVPVEKSVRILPDKLNSTLYFPMPFSVTENSLEAATLLVYIESPAGYEGERASLYVISNPWSKVITSREVVLRQGGHWEHIDITEQCRSWVKHEWKNNLGVSVEAEIAGMNLINYNNNISSNDSMSRLPLVKLQLNEKEYNRRNKRSLDTDAPLSCHPEDNEQRCCRYPFVVDFDELGPDFKFIMSPKRFWANYCKGICHEYVLPANPNMQLTRGVHKTERCCSPSSVEPLTMIYMTDEGDILRGNIPGISITSCGCD
ncbi:growth/differentiation factor 8-like [Watersipora subatra]|uniref:growth/differentiation factor 8-like n=1 Tax=Watersipora subatra TaxID=2589382 RepID=UPI00355C6421